MSSPAGWYPDPSRSDGGLLYWDGSAWTEHRAEPEQPVPIAATEAEAVSSPSAERVDAAPKAPTLTRPQDTIDPHVTIETAVPVPSKDGRLSTLESPAAFGALVGAVFLACLVLSYLVVAAIV